MLQKSKITIAMAVFLAILVAGISFAVVSASNSSDSNVIYGCYNTKSGILRIVTADYTPSHQEALISWNITGSQGPPGVGIDYIVNNGDGTFTLYLTDGSSHTTDNFTGPQGPEGPMGPQGETGPAGPGLDTLEYMTVVHAESTTSTTYTDLTTPGPSVTVNITSGKALIILTAYMAPEVYYGAYMSFAVSGASTLGASDISSLMTTQYPHYGGDRMQASATHVVTGLTNGSNTFTAKYKGTGGSVMFAYRSIIVIPLP